MSVLTSDTIAASPAQNYGDLLRSVPGVNVIQTSARDINLTSRQAHDDALELPARARRRPLRLPRFLRHRVVGFPADQPLGYQADRSDPRARVGRVGRERGNRRRQHRHEISARGAGNDRLAIGGGIFGRDAGSSAGKGPGALFGSNASISRIVNDRWSYRLSAGYFTSDALAPPERAPFRSSPIRAIRSATVGGAAYPDRWRRPTRHRLQEHAARSQPKFDARVDQELE